jgi:hypothetical protein
MIDYSTHASLQRIFLSLRLILFVLRRSHPKHHHIVLLYYKWWYHTEIQVLLIDTHKELSYLAFLKSDRRERERGERD